MTSRGDIIRENKNKLKRNDLFCIYNIYSALERINSPVQVIFEDSQCTACGVIGSKQLYALGGGGVLVDFGGKKLIPLALYVVLLYCNLDCHVELKCFVKL